MFHRLDRAIAIAIQNCPAVLEIFDIARVAQSLFGVGDGRVIYRGVAEILGTSFKRIPDQGSSRKAPALAATVRQLLDSLPILHGGMHARMADTRARRGGQTVTNLIKVGRRASSVNMVVLLLAVGDFLDRCLLPVLYRSEADQCSPWAMRRLLKSTVEQLRAATVKAYEIRRLCCVTALLS